MIRTLDIKNPLLWKGSDKGPDHGVVTYLDFSFSEEIDKNLDAERIMGSEEIDKNLDVERVMGLSVFKKSVQFTKDYSKLTEEKLEKEFLEEINKYVKPDPRLKLDLCHDKINSRRNLSKFLIAGSTIAAEGRRGPGRCILINRKKFKEIFEQAEQDKLQRLFEVYFTKDKLGYALVWRVGANDEPGAILVKNEKKYTITSLGLHPELQYCKINT